MTSEEYLAKIRQIIDRAPGSEHLPDAAPVVAMFLEGFRPADHRQPSGDNMTSLEIATALEDICRLATDDIAPVMVWLGFRLHVNSYHGHEWAMTAADIAK